MTEEEKIQTELDRFNATVRDLRDTQLRYDDRADAHAERLSTLEGIEKQRGTVSPGVLKFWGVLCSILLLSLGLLITHYQQRGSRLAAIERKLAAPRYHAGDGLVNVSCDVRTLEAVAQILDDLVAGRAGEPQPVIRLQIAECLSEQRRLEQTLKGRRDGNGNGK